MSVISETTSDQFVSRHNQKTYDCYERRLVYDAFDKVGASKLLQVIDMALDDEAYDVIEIIADYEITKISDLNHQNDMSELFAICDKELLRLDNRGNL